MHESNGRDGGSAAIAGWLAERVAYYLEKPVADVDADTPFVELGLDSVYALTLCGDIEDHYGLQVEQTLPWDYPTVKALAGQLTVLLADVPGTAAHDISGTAANIEAR